jgi:hypothetical protein
MFCSVIRMTGPLNDRCAAFGSLGTVRLGGLDDLQWADHASDALWGRLARAVQRVGGVRGQGASLSGLGWAIAGNA